MSEIDTKLSLLYDTKFNKKLDIINDMNKMISSKTAVIETTENDATKKRKKIKILYLVLAFIGWFLIAGILTVLKIIKVPLFSGIILILIIIYLVKIIKILNNNPPNFKEENMITKNAFANLDENGMAKVPVKPPTCPSQCTLHPTKKVCVERVKQKMTQNLKTDSSLNKWVYGDQPEATFYNPRIYNSTIPNLRTTEEEIEENEPQKWFPPLENNTSSTKPMPGITYYNCAKELEDEVEFRTNIPCQYYPDYKTISKCIYNDNGDCIDLN